MIALYDNYEDTVEVLQLVTLKGEKENGAFPNTTRKKLVMQRAHAFLVSKGTAIKIELFIICLTRLGG